MAERLAGAIAPAFFVRSRFTIMSLRYKIKSMIGASRFG
jgi:hypothetical protein